MKLIDLKGQTLGQWKVLSRANGAYDEAHWWCRCLCSPNCITKIVSGAALRRGSTTSCGRLTRFRAAWGVHRKRLAEIASIQGSLARLIRRVAALVETEPRRRNA